MLLMLPVRSTGAAHNNQAGAKHAHAGQGHHPVGPKIMESLLEQVSETIRPHGSSHDKIIKYDLPMIHPQGAAAELAHQFMLMG